MHSQPIFDVMADPTSVIRKAGLVRARREGTWMFYRIEHDLPGWQRDMLDAVRDGAVPELSADRLRLRKMSGRPQQQRPEWLTFG